MKLLFVAVLLVAWVPPMISTPCKTVIRIKQEAMEYACQSQKLSFQNAFGIIPIPSAIQNNQGGGGLFGLGQSIVGSVINIAGIKILDVQLPEITVNFMPNVGVQVSVDTKFHISGNILLIGNININLGAGVVADVRVSRTAKGFPILSVSACKSILGGIEVSVGNSRILPTIVNAIKGHIQAVFSDSLCLSVSNVFLGLNANFGVMAGISTIGGDLGLQYIMPSPPVVKGDYMDMVMDAVYRLHEKVIEIPTGSKDFTLPPNAGNQDSMVNMGFSQDFFISMFTAFQSSGGFNLDIPSTSASVGSYLTTSALGSYIPQIKLKYPQTLPVNINIVLSQTPIVTFQSNQLLVQITPSVEFFVVLPNMNTQHLMKINVGTTLVAKLNASGGKLKVSLALQGELDLAMVSSSCKLNPSLLTGYMQTVFEKAYLIQINGDISSTEAHTMRSGLLVNAVMSAGVSLPALPNIQLIHEAVEIKEDYAVMSCDIQYVK